MHGVHDMVHDKVRQAGVVTGGTAALWVTWGHGGSLWLEETRLSNAFAGVCGVRSEADCTGRGIMVATDMVLDWA